MMVRRYDSKTFGQRLKCLRKEYGKTQQDIADWLFISVVCVSGYEKGKTIIGHDYVAVICDYFNVSADHFYFNINGLISDEVGIDEIVILLNERKQEDRKRAYEILKLVFQKRLKCVRIN